MRGLLRKLKEPGIIWRAETDALSVTIKIQSWLPFLVFLVALGWYIAAPSPVALMSVVMLGGIIVCAFLWARAMARSVRGRRRLRFAAMQVGDELEEQIGLSNRSRLPVLWAEFVDRSSIPGYTASSARAADPDSQIEWRTHTICNQRGLFSLGPWEMRLGDPFGLFSVCQLYLQRQEILVYPPLAVLPEQVLPHHGAVGDHRPLNQPLHAETISSTTVRAYIPGDPLRHIHWRASARHAEPFVKVFAPEAASRVWLAPDFDAAVHLGEGPGSSEETMVTVIASLAFELLQQNLSVGMLASADREVVVLPRQGQHTLWNILQTLAPLHCTPQRRLEDVLDRARSLISGNDLLILVTPSLQPQWTAPLRRIAHGRGGAGRAEVILLDPISFGGQADGSAFLSVLADHGILAHLLRREDIHLVSGFYGEISRWDFSVTGTGRAVARKTPRLASPDAGQSLPLWKHTGS